MDQAVHRTRTRCHLHSAVGTFLFAGMLLAAGGCATYSAKLVNLKPELAAGQFDQALETVEKQSGSKDRLLYYLERGLILHFADRWAESNEAFAAAERTADDLYTKSISEGVLSLVSNDNAISYRARPFEMAMVPYYKALNYIYMGERRSAVVEARRASELLSRYVAATLDGVRQEDRSDLERVKNDPFLLYFSGMLYDWNGDTNDAFIAYRNAAQAYTGNAGLLELEIPPSLGTDLERTAGRLGFSEELAQLRQDCADVFEAAAAAPPVGPTGAGADRGEVVVFLEVGFVPQKTQVRFDVPIFDDDAFDDREGWAWTMVDHRGNVTVMTSGRDVEYWLSVAAPELQDQPDPCVGARISASAAGGHAVTSRVANMNRQARITFDAEKPTIFFKTLLRGLAKYLASRGVEKKTGFWGGLAANILGAATESADTRSWLTLPDGVHLARLSLPPGSYDLEVDLIDSRGHTTGTRTIPGVVVRAGDWSFVSRRVF